MARQVALLRGINVGGRKKVPMADLRRLLVDLGYQDVQTYLQSGNAVFTTAKRTSAQRVASDIERAITDVFDMDVRVLVRDCAELTRIVERNPMPHATGDGARFFVVFLSAAPDAGRLQAVDREAYAPEEFAPGQRELYLWYPQGFAQAQLTHAFWEKQLGLTATARNWNTVTKLVDLCVGETG